MVMELAEGLSYLLGKRDIAGLTVLGLSVSPLGSFFETLPRAFADKVVTGAIDTYVDLLLDAGVGGLASTGAIALLAARTSPSKFVFLSGTGYGLGLLPLS